MILKIAKWYIDLRKVLFDIQLYFAIKACKRRAKLFNKTHLVIPFNGRPRVFMKSHLKDLIKRRALYKKGVTIAQLEKMSLYKS
ncbi:MAG: hypothetical protein NTU51_05975 [Bacteroidetes bacterium]|nr:hypothetical protein [Bacteroidota bacterium]